MAANVNIVVNAQDRASGTIRKIRNAFGEIIQVALGIRLSQTLQRMGEAVRDFASNSVDAAADLQQFQIGVETLIAREQIYADATIGIADAYAYAKTVSDDYISNLQEIALLSPYQFTDVQKSFRQAMAFGFAADEAVTFTEATLNVAAGVGASNAQMDRMAYNLAQIRLQGKVTKLDIRQLALAGFDLRSVLQFVGREMGVAIETHADFNRAIANGKITWADFTRLYAEYADTYFGGASERMARTLFGLRNTFKDIFAVTMPQVLGPTLEAITEFTSGILDKLLELRDSGTLEEWGDAIKQKFDQNWKPIFEYLLYGDFTPENSIVVVLAAMREVMTGEWLEIKPGGFDTLIQILTGKDISGALDNIRLMQEVFTSTKEGNFLSDYNLENLDILLGLDMGTLSGIKDTVAAVFSDISTVMSNNLQSDASMDVFGRLFGMTGDEFAEKIRPITDAFSMMKRDVSTTFANLNAAAQPFITVFQNTFIPVWQTLLALFAQIGLYIGPMVSGIFKELSEFAAENAEFFARLWQTLGQGMQALWVVVTAVVAFLAPVIEGLIGFILGMFSGLIAWLQGDNMAAWENVKGAFLDLIGGIWDGLLQMGDFLLQIWDEHIWPTIEGWIAEGATWGANLINSIAQGFADGAAGALKWITEGIGKITDWVKTQLKMESPSKVFMEMGALSMEGFVRGLQPDRMLPASIGQSAIPNMARAGAGGGRQVVINQHYHGLTLNDRMQAERDLRPIVDKLMRR